jgi:hypothetical protein
MDRSIKAGVSGFSLSIIINLFSPIYLYFVPSFLVAIFAIYIFRLETLKDGILAAFMIYIFSDGIFSTIILATWYLANEQYPSFNVDIWTMFSPMVSAVTALIAGYIGVWLVQKMKPARELPPPPPQPLPPV